jgi:hypothetical protein
LTTTTAPDDNTDPTNHRYCITTANMRTYDDAFSGQKIYPGKVRSAVLPTEPPDVETKAHSATLYWRTRSLETTGS